MPSLKNNFKPGDLYFVRRPGRYAENAAGFRFLTEINKGMVKILYIK